MTRRMRTHALVVVALVLAGTAVWADGWALEQRTPTHDSHHAAVENLPAAVVANAPDSAARTAPRCRRRRRVRPRVLGRSCADARPGVVPRESAARAGGTAGATVRARARRPTHALSRTLPGRLLPLPEEQ